MISILNSSLNLSTMKLNENFIESIMKENHIEENLRDTIFTYYKSLPVINSVTVISTLNSILSAFIKDYNTHIAHINFDEKKIKKIDYVNRDDSEFNSEYYKKYRYIYPIFQVVLF